MNAGQAPGIVVGTDKAMPVASAGKMVFMEMLRAWKGGVTG